MSPGPKVGAEGLATARPFSTARVGRLSERAVFSSYMWELYSVFFLSEYFL